MISDRHHRIPIVVLIPAAVIALTQSSYLLYSANAEINLSVLRLPQVVVKPSNQNLTKIKTAGTHRNISFMKGVPIMGLAEGKIAAFTPAPSRAQ